MLLEKTWTVSSRQHKSLITVVLPELDDPNIMKLCSSTSYCTNALVLYPLYLFLKLEYASYIAYTITETTIIKPTHLIRVRLYYLSQHIFWIGF